MIAGTKFLVATVIIASVQLITPIIKAESQFCSTGCSCNETTINCNSKGLGFANVWDPLIWTNNGTKQSYQYEVAIFSRNDHYKFDQPIPESPVKILDLSYMNIKMIANKVFINLQQMQELFLNDNLLETLDKDVFQGVYVDNDYLPMRSLTKLHLDNNKLIGLPNDFFDHIKHLTVLTLSGNPLTILDSKTETALNELSDLEYLDLSRTRLTLLSESFLNAPKHLKFFNLSDNDLQEIPGTLRYAHSLETLVLDNNQLQNVTEDHVFPDIPTLKVLYMRRMPNLHYLGPRSLGGLSYNLTELYLNDNPLLSHIDDMALARKDAENDVWPKLEKLFIQDCQLTHIEKELFPEWRKLKDMDISGNPWTCECENQWIVEELIGDFYLLHKEKAEAVMCAAPIEMEKKSIYSLTESRYEMRCLDLYGHRPEKDGTLLVATLVVLLIGIPLVLFLVYAYQRRWFFCCDNSPAAFSRQFYSRTSGDNDF